MMAGVFAVSKCAWAVVSVVGRTYSAVNSVRYAKDAVQEVFKKDGE